jgi:hypothetical protein
MIFHEHRPPGAAGIPLRGLAAALRSAGYAVREEALQLVARHPAMDAAVEALLEGPLETFVDVLPAADADTGNAPVFGAMRVRTPLRSSAVLPLEGPARRAELNRFATLGALHLEQNRPVVGSRITLYEDHQTWELLAPLAVAAVMHGAPSLLRALARGKRRAQQGGGSAWKAADFTRAERLLSPVMVCAAGARDFTAEFALRVEAGAARAGSRGSALWRLGVDEAHGGAGAGLGGKLELPHAFEDPAQALRAAERLNGLEMTARDLPPHFGAWCAEGARLGYRCFLPNELHPVPALAVNLSVWARARALWAQRKLRARRRPR